MAEDIGFGRLPRGAKILWERVAHSRTLSLGFFFATGSRFDPLHKAGTAHFVEHLLFKGTRSHSAASLARLVDRVGGDLNAWTDREEMAFTCTVPAEFWEVAVEALSELCFWPTFPREEFDREKEVIRNEILSSLDDPEEVSYETFLQRLSPGKWSSPVAGTEKSLLEITWEDTRNWWHSYGTAGRLTVAFSGNMDPEIVTKAITEKVAQLEDVPDLRLQPPGEFSPTSGFWTEKSKFQMAQIIGGFSFDSPKTPRAAAVWQIFSMLWGETMSSRLFQKIREEQGLCYSLTSQVFDSDHCWGLQFFVTCAPENVGRVIDSLGKEILRLTTAPPTETEWTEARLALRGGVVLGAERSENRAGRLWRQWETFKVVVGVEETLEYLEKPVTEEEKQEILSVLVGQVPSLMVWGKVHGKIQKPAPWNP